MRWSQYVIAITMSMHWGMGSDIPEAIAAACHAGAKGNQDCLIRVIVGPMALMGDAGIHKDLLTIHVPKGCHMFRLGGVLLSMIQVGEMARLSRKS